MKLHFDIDMSVCSLDQMCWMYMLNVPLNNRKEKQQKSSNFGCTTVQLHHCAKRACAHLKPPLPVSLPLCTVASQIISSPKTHPFHYLSKFCLIHPYYARFTLADPMPRLGSDVVGGNSGRNHPTSRRHTIHIGRMARNVSFRVGWYEGVVQYCTTPWLVR